MGFKNLTSEEIKNGLVSPEKAYELHQKIYVRSFGVEKTKRQDYIDEMKTLHNNMMPKEKRSGEYRALYDAVTKVAEMNPNDTEFYDANNKLIKAIKNYTKGKKNVRTKSEGKARFDR